MINFRLITRLFKRLFDENRRGRVHFSCPICEDKSWTQASELHREGGVCRSCGSTVRHRAIILAVLKESGNRPWIYFWGLSRRFSKVKKRNTVIIGLSDHPVMVDYLTPRYTYTNTFYDVEPKLDITSPEITSQADILISSDVFEHTLGDPSFAFAGAASVLKVGGKFVLTVPYEQYGQTIEHYPGLKSYLFDSDTGRTFGLFEDGERELINAIYHGGPGITLEMRMFSKDGVLSCLQKAGFVNIEINERDIPRYGIYYGGRVGVFTATATK